MTLPLHRRYPGTASLATAGIASLPTPVDNAGDLLPLDEDAGQRFPVHGLWVKRDDLTSSAYGGNKVRKLDFLLGEAQARGCRAVITFGAYGSNHALATAVHAKAVGLEAHVVLSPQEPGPYAPRTLLAHAGLGSHIHVVEGWDGSRKAVEVRAMLRERDGVDPCVIPMGGTNALGAVGYVNAALELAEQVSELDLGPLRVQVGDFVVPDVVYVAAGTLGTAVGLAVGFAAAGWSTRVEAVRVTPLEVGSEAIVSELVPKVAGLLRSLDDSFPQLDAADLALTLRHDHFDPGYGVVTPATTQAVELARAGGLALETTYTGKAFSAMLADAKAGRLEDEHVVFWDTYNSAPYPTAGPLEALPAVLQDYVAECERRFGRLS